MDERRDVIIQGLMAQKDMLDTVRALQLTWAENAENSEAAQLHLETAELLIQASNQCDRLLGLYLPSPDIEARE